MVRQTVKSHSRKTRSGKVRIIKTYNRKKRRTTTKQRTTSTKPFPKRYPVRDEFGQIRGYTTKPPRRKKRL